MHAMLMSVMSSSLPTLVLIALAVFLLEHGPTHRHRKSQMQMCPTYATAIAGVGKYHIAFVHYFTIPTH